METDEIGFTTKNCAKCHAEMKVPDTRPIELRCPSCGQRHVYKKVKTATDSTSSEVIGKPEFFGSDTKNCPRCKAEVKVPQTRPVEVQCPSCGQLLVYKKKKTKGSGGSWWPFSRK